MAPRYGDPSMATCLNRPEDDLSKVVAELEASATIFFRKTLVRRSCRRFSQCEKLSVPTRFVRDHADKFKEWVYLQTLSSTKPWIVRLGIARTPSGAPQVCLKGGWSKFAAANRLKEGDSLIFALNDNGKSEFRVYIFRFPTDSRPSFRRQLNVYTEKQPMHRMEVPARFVIEHGMPEQLRGLVKLQGVHEESPVRIVECQWIKQGENTTRLFFTAGWLEFAEENGLKIGQELKFTLTSDSFFVVRVVV